ncbi:hypothetical protein Ddye_013600 [Dipteronia dyeriana]|uniref:SCP domain-containing protein n=1 Tax=Dipteronia dyeriana TaxID=168575 RepID=A0AAD9X6P3_9ROSI|nr:hypothetical protein Ddye_013600 [Dipteronia dyeriana]
MGSGDLTGTAAVKLWVDEKPNTTTTLNSCVGGGCRHYTQAVWRNSVRLGCAKVVSAHLDDQRLIVDPIVYNHSQQQCRSDGHCLMNQIESMLFFFPLDLYSNAMPNSEATTPPSIY